MANKNAVPVRIGNYFLGATIGSGAFGKVKVATHQVTGRKVAFKMINRLAIQDGDYVDKIQREILNHKLFKHPHIIKLYQVISTPTDIFLVMEYITGGELFDYLGKPGERGKKLPVPEARRLFQQIISGVEYCHRHMVVHRDLKPENILLDSNKCVKIGDFGLSVVMTDGKLLETSCGSSNYAAPEILCGKPYIGPEVDVWSCGVILYTLLCGFLPFDDDYPPELYRKVKAGVFYRPDYLQEGAVLLLSHMLKVNPFERATIKEIRESAWFKKDLPDYLFPTFTQDTSTVDTWIVREICEKFDVEENVVLRALLAKNVHSQFYITYHLILENQLLLETVGFKEFYQSISPQPKASSSTANPIRPHADRMPKLRMTLEDGSVSSDSGFEERASWYLGINSTSNPHDIMHIIYFNLLNLNFEWQNISLWHILIQKRDPVTLRLSKLSLQLFYDDKIRLNVKSFVLDFMNISDDPSDVNDPSVGTSSTTSPPSDNDLNVGTSSSATSLPSDANNLNVGTSSSATSLPSDVNDLNVGTSSSTTSLPSDANNLNVGTSSSTTSLPSDANNLNVGTSSTTSLPHSSAHLSMDVRTDTKESKTLPQPHHILEFLELCDTLIAYLTGRRTVA